MMFRLVEKMADKEGVTEQLKTEAPMLWVGRRLWARRKKISLVSAGKGKNNPDHVLKRGVYILKVKEKDGDKDFS